MRLALTFIICFCSVVLMAQEHMCETSQVKADYEELATIIKTAHINPYAYVSEATLEMAFNNVNWSMYGDSISLKEATNIFTKYVTTIKMGHTWVRFPVKSYLAYAEQGGTVFPLEIAIENEVPIIRKNWSPKPVPIGAEVLSINDVPIQNLLFRIGTYVSAESQELKNAKIELYTLPRLMWQVYGHMPVYRVKVKHGANIELYELAGVRAMEEYENIRNDFMTSEQELTFYDSVAYLNAGAFGGNLEAFKSYIDSTFIAINRSKTNHLILDFRNNSGGDNNYSDYLVSYIADRSFAWNSRYTFKTSKELKEHVRSTYDTTTAFAQSLLKHNNGEQFNYEFTKRDPQPDSLRFKGEVWVLINRHSYSQAAVTAAQIQDYKWGTLVGEPTAEWPSLYASIFNYTLPKTGIEVMLCKGYMVRVNGSEMEEGVQPEIVIQDHLLDEEDEILNQLLLQIQQFE